MVSLWKKIMLAALPVALLAHTLSGQLAAYTTEKVFLMSVDGIRDHEAFAYEFQPEDEEHPYIPFSVACETDHNGY